MPAPTVNIAALVTGLIAKGADPADLPITSGLVADVVVTLTLKTGGTHRIQSETSLAELGHTTETARSIALERLVTAVSNCDVNRDEAWHRITSATQPAVTASFLIIADGWVPGLGLDGEPVIAIPTRSDLHVCGSNDTATIEQLTAVAAQAFEEATRDPARASEALIPHLLTLREGRLEQFS